MKFENSESALRIDADRMNQVFDDSKKYPGLLISLVGFDGAGKTTQVKAIANRYRELGRTVIETRQPTEWYRTQADVKNSISKGET